MKEDKTIGLQSDVEAIINRHIARLMTDLEQADCPRVFREAAKSEIQWLRSDVLDIVARAETE